MPCHTQHVCTSHVNSQVPCVKQNFKNLRHTFVDSHELFHMLLVSFLLVQNRGHGSQKYVNMDDVTDCAIMFAIFGKHGVYY